MKNIETSAFTDGGVAVLAWSNAKGWPIKFATKSVESMFGYTQEEIAKKKITLEDIVHKEDKKKIGLEFEKFVSLDVESFNNSPFRAVHKDGNVIWLKTHIKIIKKNDSGVANFYGYAVDITSQIEAVNELELIFNGLADGIVIFGVDSKRIVKTNSAFCGMLGFDAFELFDKELLEIVSGAKKEEALQKLLSAEKDKTNYLKEIQLAKRGGGALFTNITTNIIRYKQDTCIIAIVKDITEQRAMGEERKQHEKIMIQQSKLAAMGEMISMIAHQWRQPLSSISTSAANMEVKLQLGVSDNDAFISSLHEIGEQAQHLSSTINDFRDFFNPKKEKKTILPTAIIDKAASIIEKTLYANNIRLDVNVSYKKPISTYVNELVQVVLNLLKNSNDAFMENRTSSAKIVINGYEKDNCCYIEIIDNAGGIKEEIKERIFDPYFTTKEEKSGTGLGLYISKLIVEKHCNGRLEVSDIKEKDDMTAGTAFTIILCGNDAGDEIYQK